MRYDLRGKNVPISVAFISESVSLAAQIFVRLGKRKEKETLWKCAILNYVLFIYAYQLEIFITYFLHFAYKLHNWIFLHNFICH